MASNLKLATSLRNTMVDAIATAIGSGGKLKIYTGAQPAGPGTAVTTQTLLGTLTGGSPFAPAASGGVLTANSITQDSAADATGTAAWFRVETSGGTGVYDGSVGTSDADLVLNTTSVVVGGPIQVTSLTITAPGG